MISAFALLGDRQSTELAAPNDQSRIKKTASLQVCE